MRPYGNERDTRPCSCCNDLKGGRGRAKRQAFDGQLIEMAVAHCPDEAEEWAERIADTEKQAEVERLIRAGDGVKVSVKHFARAGR